MKLFQLILITLLSGFIRGQETKNEITITGNITGKIPAKIDYTLPIDGINYFGFKNSVQPDSVGEFHIKLAVDRACFIELSNVYDSYGTIIVEPGMDYNVLISTQDKTNMFKVKCKNKEGQDLYNQTTNRSMITGHFESEARQYSKDSIPSQIKQNIKSNKEAEISKYRRLLKANVISEGFYNLVRTDREYFYAGVQGSVAFINYLFSDRGQNNLDKKEYSELWKEIFKSYPPSNPELLRSPWFFYYTQNYLRYKELIEGPKDSEPLSEINKRGLLNTHYIQIAKEYLSGKQLEYYYAAHIYYEAINKNYEKELITLFEQFKKDYPTSSYTRFIEPEITQIIAFQKKQNESLNENIHFLDNPDKINSLKEAVKELKGERFYVDVWATWCGPCKKEFEYNDKLYTLLKSKGMTMLYLSVDKDDRKEQWGEMIKYYELKGYHIRVNDKFQTDLENLRGNDTFGIPWHILTDGEGNIIKKYVSGPSDIKDLERQLNEN